MFLTGIVSKNNSVCSISMALQPIVIETYHSGIQYYALRISSIKNGRKQTKQKAKSLIFHFSFRYQRSGAFAGPWMVQRKRAEPLACFAGQDNIHWSETVLAVHVARSIIFLRTIPNECLKLFP